MESEDRSARSTAYLPGAFGGVADGGTLTLLASPSDATHTWSDDEPRPATVARASVIVVDDHRAFAESLAIVINACPDLGCIATATTLAEGIALTGRLTPDIVLLDVRLPDGDGVDAIGRFREAYPEARILILTGYPDLDVLTRAAGAGASGFLQKDSSIAGIVRALRSARDGDILVEQATLASILERLRSGTATQRNTDGVPHFTTRELDVLALMGEGLDPHAIASLLTITLNTCRGYEKSIMAKLDAHSQLEAVVISLRRGLIKASPDGDPIAAAR